MKQSNYESYEDFIAELQLANEDARISRYKDYAFIILKNTKIPWCWYTEKLTQNLFWNLSGGITGAGSGHHIYFEDNLQNGLLKAKDAGKTHAMVCSVGMVLNGKVPNQKDNFTPVQSFFKFAESDKFMKAHILAHPNKPATIHQQHLEINLQQWNGEDLLKLGEDYERSEENFHDDYTPHWIKVPQHPLIDNFPAGERRWKKFLYPHKEFEKNANYVEDCIIHQHHGFGHVAKNDFIEINGPSVWSKKYYLRNNEQPLHRNTDKKFDVIFAPSAGIFAESLYNLFGHDTTKTIIYDYEQKFLNFKKTILNNGFCDNEDLRTYGKYLEKEYPKLCFDYAQMGFINNAKAYENLEKEYDLDKKEKIQNDFIKSDYTFKRIDLLNYNFDDIIDDINGKSVLFFTSNVFRYSPVWIIYDFHHIKNQYLSLINTLENNTSDYLYLGKTYTGKILK